MNEKPYTIIGIFVFVRVAVCSEPI